MKFLANILFLQIIVSFKNCFHFTNIKQQFSCKSVLIKDKEYTVLIFSGSISNIDGAEYNCNKTQVRKVISGVVGAASSVTSIQVANLLRLFKIPQVN